MLHSAAHTAMKVLLSASVLMPCTASAGGRPHPGIFIANRGQWAGEALFRAGLDGAFYWITSDGIVYQFVREPDLGSVCADEGTGSCSSCDVLVLSAALRGASPDAVIEGEGADSRLLNFLTGDDPGAWVTGVPAYAAVVCRDVYPGIDLEYLCGVQGLEWRFLVGPGADPSCIRLEFDGTVSCTVGPGGGLAVGTGRGTSSVGVPVALQDVGMGRAAVPCSFETDGDGLLGLSVEGRDPSLPMVIDLSAALEFSTFLGGSLGEEVHGVAVDASGSVYVTGCTWSPDFPTQVPFQGALAGIDDVFVTKFSPDGSQIEYSTYLGGAAGGDDCAMAVAVGPDSCAFVVGRTNSTDFPVQGPFQGTNAGANDAFVTKFSPDGSQLLFSTYLGGGGTDIGLAIAVDASGSAYAGGRAGSTNFPTQGPFQGDQPGWDGFLAKLSPSGGQMVFGTYLGGSGEDLVEGVALDPSGRVLVTGRTLSTDFPVQNPFQGTFGGVSDAFVTRFATSGSQIDFSTYFGGSAWDAAYALAVDGSGSVILTGETESGDFPLANPLQPSIGGGRDAFVARIEPGGGPPAYSTYLGGSAMDAGYGIAAGTGSSAFVSGITSSAGFPTWNPFQASYGGGPQDVFAVELAPDGSAMQYGTFLGGSGSETSRCIAVDPSGSVYVAGETDSGDFPLQSPWQGGLAGQTDAFLTKLTAGTGVADPWAPQAAGPEIVGAFPNPFGSTVEIIVSTGRAGWIRLTIHDPAGRLTADLGGWVVQPGVNSFVWSAGSQPSGVYLVRILSDDGSSCSRSILLLD